MSSVLFDSGIPSNFYRGAPIYLPNPIKPTKNTEFRTNEHYFQACKVALSSQGTIEMYRDIAQADTPSLAKHLGYLVPLDQEEIGQWNEHDSLVVMLEANLAKFRQHPHCRRWLKSTRKATLIEHRPDKRWGDGMDGSGQNLLGQILMLVRSAVC